MSDDPQLTAASPALSVGVRANAGTGKTWTLVARVARLLLHGARPDAILCVTYTKAAAAEMQTRLFERLGDWSVMDDDGLAEELAKLDEGGTDLAKARRLFARALETPGGLKIQTLHAFCEKLLRRFPLEADLSPGFTVLENAAQAQVLARSREALAHQALADGSGDLGAAYAHMAVQLDERSFDSMLAGFSARRRDIGRYLQKVGIAGLAADVWRRCGFDAPASIEQIEGEALAAFDPRLLRQVVGLLSTGGKRAQEMADLAASLAETLDLGTAQFATAIELFCTKAGTPRAFWETDRLLSGQPALQNAMLDTRDQILAAQEQLRAAAMATDTLAVISLAAVQIGLYEEEKRRLGALDFDDLTDRAQRLLDGADGAAAWVLYKLDYGIDHLLLDEAQDTAPAQWDILHALTGEFFAGEGLRGTDRTAFFVGDEKQSIYGFQGAAPARLGQEVEAYDQRVSAAGGEFQGLALIRSRRSRPEVLALVDAVCNTPQARAALQPGQSGDAAIEHATVHEAGGCVDLWPLEESEEREEPDYWLPVDVEPVESGNSRLARRISLEVRRLIDANEGTAGDVLVLVRRRGALFDEIIRALKDRGIPTAGADRLKLTSHIGVMDLLALARVCLFPGDELSLAAVLRSPLFDVSETELFELACGRAQGLWPSLCARSAELPAWAQARALLDWAMAEAGRCAPFDFYGRVLSRLDHHGLSMRQRLVRRLGTEAGEVLDEFLAQTLNLESAGAVSLEAFVAAMSASDFEVKREQEAAGGKVRVMTVHAAKGLEARIVFLPDTTGLPPEGGALLDEDGAFLWAPRKAEDIAASTQARQARKLAAEQESLRLLYVGMTRARERLVICGVRRMDRNLGMEEGCWYQHLAAGHGELASREIRAGDWSFRRHGPDPGSTEKAAREAAFPVHLPAWTLRPAPAEARRRDYASPSTLAGQASGPAVSPLSPAGSLGRFRRGNLIHRLLQLLPDLPPGQWSQAADDILAREADLDPAQADEIAAAALGVLHDPQFAEVFGPGSRAEAAVAGSSPRLPGPISGRIDRLTLLQDRVLVADFKTNRPPPVRIEDADPAYILQMAAYRAVLAEVFPGRRIEAALVWTDGPRLMTVPEILMDEALARIASGA